MSASKLSLSVLVASILTASCFPANAQETSENNANQTQIQTPPNNFEPQIIPAHPDAIGGGNPFQGIGRPDDPGTSRVQEFLESTTLPKPPGPDSTVKPQGKKNTGTTRDTKQAEPETAQMPDKQPDKQQKEKAPTPQLSDQRLALQLIQNRQYTRAFAVLKNRKKTHPRDYKSKYLLAITYVYLGKNERAKDEYKDIILNSFNTELVDLAKQGFEKISPSQKEN